MNYVRIKNKGLIENDALHLLGASTKTTDETKIGQFGSGNKYALAYLLRNKYTVKIFAGKNEINISTNKKVFRGQDFNIISIDGKETSITTSMGKDWKFWQSIREIYCNALDEGDCTMDIVSDIEPKDDETHFYIDNRDDMMDFMINFDTYFSTKKKAICHNKYGSILEKTGNHANIYRRGIKCHETDRKSVYDYDFKNILIGEDRLILYSWLLSESIWKLIFSCEDEDVILSVLNHCGNFEYIESQISDYATISGDFSDTFKKVISKHRFAPIGMSGLLDTEERTQCIIIPTKIFQFIRHLFKSKNVNEKFDITSDGASYRKCGMKPLHKATLKKAMDFFNECKYEIEFNIVMALFDDKKILGYAETKTNTIILSDICLDKGVNEVVNTIIEEKVHLKYDVRDKTRAMQTAIIDELINYMKEKNTYLL